MGNKRKPRRGRENAQLFAMRHGPDPYDTPWQAGLRCTRFGATVRSAFNLALIADNDAVVKERVHLMLDRAVDSDETLRRHLRETYGMDLP